MRVWSSDVCSSDLPIPPPRPPTGSAATARRGNDRESDASCGDILLPLDMQAMLAPGDEEPARADQRRPDPCRLGGEGAAEEPAAGDSPDQRRIAPPADHRDRRQPQRSGQADLHAPARQPAPAYPLPLVPVSRRYHQAQCDATTPHLRLAEPKNKI